MPIDPRDQPDFEPTQPPALAEDMALAFGPLGISTLCASTVDTESMAFESCWRILERGGSIQATPAGEPEGGFPAAMATIVHLTQLPGDQIVTRKLDPCRWVFAWHVDRHRVAVAEATYRVPRSEQGQADGELMRLIFEAGIRAASCETAEAMNDHSPWPARQSQATLGFNSRTVAMPPAGVSARPALVVMRTSGVPFAQPPSNRRRLTERRLPRAGDNETAVSGRPRWTQRTLALVVLSTYLGTAALITLARRDTAAVQAEAELLRARVDATMLQHVDETLARGDYGEVQHELDRLARLKHFNGAVVTNARGRTVAMAGEVRDVRIGDSLPAEVAASGRVLPLATTGGIAQLLLWDVERAQSQGWLAGSSTLLLGLGVCAAATAAALFIARRQRRTLQRRAQP